MTIFLLVCAALVLLSGVFYLFPRVRAGAAEEDLDAANLEWFRQREAELVGEDNDALREDARIRLLEDQREFEKGQKASAQSFPVWVLLPFVALLAGGLYFVLGGAQDVVITQRLSTMQEDMTQQEMRILISDVEARSAQRPENMHYLTLLGRYYMSEQDYPLASQTYATLVEAAPEDPQALAYAAQAAYLAAGRSLGDLARLQAEQSLAADPQQRTALGLLGMASFEQGQFRAAIEYWQRLLVMEPAGSDSAQMISQVIETATQRLAAADSGAAAPPLAPSIAPASSQDAAAAPSIGVTVQISVPDDAAVSATDTVFVLARNADSDSRMPIAVQRLTAAQLPVTLRLDDSNSMAGQKLSETASVIVAVQVSADGRPGEDGASWLGQVGPVTPSMDKEALAIVLQAKAPGS